MSDRIGTLKNKLNYISPTNYRPTKEMLEKYENIWLPLRKKIKEQKKNNKKLFLIYGDFNIIEIKNNMINEITSNQSSKKVILQLKKNQTLILHLKNKHINLSSLVNKLLIDYIKNGNQGLY